MNNNHNFIKISIAFLLLSLAWSCKRYECAYCEDGKKINVKANSEPEAEIECLNASCAGASKK